MTRNGHIPRWLGALVLGLIAAPGLARTSPPDPATLVPADVSLYLRVTDAAAIRRDLDVRPLGEALRGLLDGPLREAWAALVVAADQPEAEVFDTWLGRDVVLVLRAALTLPDTLTPTDIEDWAIITCADRRAASRFVERLNPRRLAPRGPRTVLELPEHALRVAGGADDGLFVIGPARDAGLFEDVLTRLTRGAESAGSLAADGGFARLAPLARTLAEEAGEQSTTAAVRLFARHDPFYGGWSVAAARPAAPIKTGRWTLRHHACFEAASIFPRDVTKTRWAPVLLDRFARESLMTFIEPADIGTGPIAGYANAKLGRPLLSADLRRITGDVRLFVIGEVESPGADGGPGMLRPALALALPITRTPVARVRSLLDEHLTIIAEGVDRLGDGAFDLAIPDLRGLPAAGPRAIDLRPALAELGAGSPLLDTVTLNWDVVRGSGTSWAVIASHPEHLRTVTAVLERETTSPAAYGSWASCGVVNGQRLGVHLRSWGDHLAQLTGGEPAATEAFGRTLATIGSFAGGVERLEWTLERTSRMKMDLTVRVQLSAPESSGPRASKGRRQP